MKDVNPFLAKYAGSRRSPRIQAGPGALRRVQVAQRQLRRHDPRAKLTEIQTELKKFMEEQGGSWEQNIVRSRRRPLAWQEGRVRPGAAKINEFGEKFKEKEKLELFKKLKEQRDFLDRQSTQFVKNEVSKGQKDVADGTIKKDEFKKKLEGYRAGLEGYKKALEALEAAISAIK
jgi:hypothetical protein